MSSTKQQFLTPIMRMVQGDPFEKQTKDMSGAPLTIKTGPQAGQPTQRYFVAGAIAKNDPGLPAFWALLQGVAKQGFPQLFDAAGNCVNPRFAWKMTDGDSTVPDESGRRPCDKEGFPGHFVFKFSSSFPPKCFYKDHYQPHEQIQDPNIIRRGHYIRVSGTVESNGNTQKPGLFVNLGMVEYVGGGVEIVSGPDAAATFGGTPAASLPPGATPLPGAVNGAPMPGMPGAQPGMPVGIAAPAAMPQMPGTQAAMPGLPGAPQGMPQMPQMPQMPAAGMPQTAVPPNHAFAAGPGAAPQGMPQPPAAMPQPPVPPAGPQLTPAAQSAAPGVSFQQWLAMGWTEQAMRTAGYLV